MLSGTAVVPLLDHRINLNIAFTVWSEHNSNDLLTRPKFDRLQNTRWGQFHALIAIVEVSTDLHEFRSVEKAVLLGQ